MCPRNSPTASKPLSIKLLVIGFYILPHVHTLAVNLLPLHLAKVILPFGTAQFLDAPMQWSDTTVFMGGFVQGPLAVLIRAGQLIIPICIGIGIWKLWEWMRRFAIAWQVFWFLNAILLLCSPVIYHATIKSLLKQEWSIEQAKSYCWMCHGGAVVLSLVGLIIASWVLVKKRSAFIND